MRNQASEREVLQHLYEHGPLSADELADLRGTSPRAARKYAQRRVSQGRLRQWTQRSGERGRPKKVFDLVCCKYCRRRIPPGYAGCGSLKCAIASMVKGDYAYLRACRRKPKEPRRSKVVLSLARRVAEECGGDMRSFLASHPGPRILYDLIVSAGANKCTQSDLISASEKSRSTVYRHLSFLLSYGLVYEAVPLKRGKAGASEKTYYVLENDRAAWQRAA